MKSTIVVTALMGLASAQYPVSNLTTTSRGHHQIPSGRSARLHTSSATPAITTAPVAPTATVTLAPFYNNTIHTVVDYFVTVCASATVIDYNNVVYTATAGETITVTNCPCTIPVTPTTLVVATTTAPTEVSSAEAVQGSAVTTVPATTFTTAASSVTEVDSTLTVEATTLVSQAVTITTTTGPAATSQAGAVGTSPFITAGAGQAAKEARAGPALALLCFLAFVVF